MPSQLTVTGNFLFICFLFLKAFPVMGRRWKHPRVRGLLICIRSKEAMIEIKSSVVLKVTVNFAFCMHRLVSVIRYMGFEAQ